MSSSLIAFDIKLIKNEKQLNTDNMQRIFNDERRLNFFLLSLKAQFSVIYNIFPPISFAIY